MSLAILAFLIKAFLKDAYTNGLWGPAIIPQFILIFFHCSNDYTVFTFCHCKTAHTDSGSHTQCIQLTPFLSLSFAWSATSETITRAAETKQKKEAWLDFHWCLEKHIQIHLRAKVYIPHRSNATWEWNHDMSYFSTLIQAVTQKLGDKGINDLHDTEWIEKLVTTSTINIK